MSLRWQVGRRVAFAILSAYLVLSVAFGFVALTADPNVNIVRQQAAMESQGTSSEERSELIEERVAAYREARNLDEPVLDRYVRWVVDVSTFDWGRSHSVDRSVTAAVAHRLPYTLLYVIPALVLAVLAGIAIGVYAALDQGTMLASVGRLLAYVGLSVPNFWLASALVLLLATRHDWVADGIDAAAGPTDPGNLLFLALPTLVLTSTLLAGQLRYTRAQALEYIGTEFLTLIRAKGLRRYQIAGHLLRNAAVPLLTLFFSDLLGLIVLNVYVLEFVFDIPGFGMLSYQAIKARDLPLVLGTVMVVAGVGIVGTLIQDLAYLLLDPRIDYDRT